MTPKYTVSRPLHPTLPCNTEIAIRHALCPYSFATADTPLIQSLSSIPVEIHYLLMLKPSSMIYLKIYLIYLPSPPLLNFITTRCRFPPNAHNIFVCISFKVLIISYLISWFSVSQPALPEASSFPECWTSDLVLYIPIMGSNECQAFW